MSWVEALSDNSVHKLKDVLKLPNFYLKTKRRAPLGHSIPHILLGLLVSGMHKEHNSAIFRLSRYEQINVNKNKLPLKGRNSGNAQRTKSKAFKLKGYSRSLEGFLPVFNKHSGPECWERQPSNNEFPRKAFHRSKYHLPSFGSETDWYTIPKGFNVSV